MGTRLTSRYTLVVHDVASNQATLWMGALFPSLGKPKNWRLVVTNTKTAKKRTMKFEDGWIRPFNGLNKRFYKIVTIKGLEPGTAYEVEFQARSEHSFRTLEVAYFDTLPMRLPRGNQSPFTIGLGSCFYTKHDGGRVGQAYQALYQDKQFQPHIKFLTGDQVYLDIGLGWYPLNKSDTQERIADDYAESWELLRSMLRRGGTWMLPDDHEYWNNYPFLEGFNPYLVTLDLDSSFRKRWDEGATCGVSNVQMITPVRIFNIGKDVSFCVADLRSHRTKQQFIDDENFNKITQWAQSLICPGVLVTPQPLIQSPGGKSDYSLPNWKGQYGELVAALAASGHDILLLSGDVHYGRISEVKLGSGPGRLVEVISSPMSNLSELNGYAASTPKESPKNFPPIQVPGIQKNKVIFHRKVSTESKWWELRYPKRRTQEHIMTLSLNKVTGGVQLSVQAWRVRELAKNKRLPSKDFGRPFSTILK